MTDDLQKEKLQNNSWADCAVAGTEVSANMGLLGSDEEALLLNRVSKTNGTDKFVERLGHLIAKTFFP